MLINTFLSVTNSLRFFQKFIMKTYFVLKNISLPAQKEYGLDYTDTVIENAPLVISRPKNIHLTREE